MRARLFERSPHFQSRSSTKPFEELHLETIEAGYGNIMLFDRCLMKDATVLEDINGAGGEGHSEGDY